MKFAKTLFASLMVATSASAMAQEAANLDDLLSQLQQGQIAQSQQNKAREQEFISKRSEQQRLLSNAVNTRDNAVKLSTELEAQFQNNEIDIANRTDALNKRMGELKELFGVLQQVAGDTRSKFQTSVISAEISGRTEFLDEFAKSMGSTSKLASIEEIEQLWFELQREMTENGKVKTFQSEVVKADGTKAVQDVLRIGGFNLTSNGVYLEYVDETGSIAELIRQPSARYLDTVADLEGSKSEVAAFALDPTGGSILGLLVQAPNTQEQVEQGGPVGYVILAIGAIGLLIALERFITLFLIGGKVRRQQEQQQQWMKGVPKTASVHDVDDDDDVSWGHGWTESKHAE